MNEKNSLKASVTEIKTAYNIADYISQAGIQLKQNGVNKWKGLCPFHNEKTPSFIVNEYFQNYRCFGCGANGDLLTFVQEYEHLDFYSAIQKLAADKGITLSISSEESGIDYTSIKEVLKETANYYVSEYRKLNKEHPARQQVIERELNERKLFYGYAPEKRRSLYDLLKNKGYSEEIMMQAGVISRFEKDGKISYSDFWNGRLMFIITDIAGKPVGFSGRKLYENDSRGKYVNSSDGPLFDKSSILFNLSNAKKKASEEKTIYITEGQFDVASFVEAGLTNVVASSGTAFTEKQGLICRRLVTESGKIVFCFDGDKAGIKAAEKVFQTIPMIHSQAYVVIFPKDQDPCDYRLQNGNEGLVKFVSEKEIHIIEFMIDQVSKKYDLKKEIERSKFLDEAARVLKSVNSLSLREVYTKKVALEAFVTIETVKNVIETAQPFDMNSHSSKEETSSVSSRPNLEEIDQTELVKKIKENETYQIAIRLISLSLLDSEFLQALKKSIHIIPKDLVPLVKEIVTKVTFDRPIIPEIFTHSELMKSIMSKNFFPLIHLMDREDQKEQFMHLFYTLKGMEQEKEILRVKMNISNILENSNEEDVAFFISALNKEKEELEALKKS